MIRSKKKILARVLLALFAAVFVCGAFTTEVRAEDQFNTQCENDLDVYAGAAKSFTWWKEPFRVISEATITVGETTFNTVAPGAVKLMTVGFLLWLVIFMMKNLSSLKEVEPMEMLTKVGGMMFKTGFAYCMLIDSSFFFGTFVSPITATAAGFVGLGGGEGGGLQSVISPLEKLMEDMHDTVTYGIGVGDYAICLSQWERLPWPFEDLLEKEGVRDGYPEFEVMASGCIVYIGCWLLLLAFPFWIFDAMIRLGVTAALCPLFIVAWVFPITTEFAKKGLNSVLNVAFLFICLKIILDLDVELILGASGMRDDLVGDGKERAFMDALIKGNNLIVAFVCVFYALLFTKQAGELANFFATTDFKNNTAWQATQYAGQTVGNTASAAGGLAGAGARKIRQGVDRAAARTVERGRQAREKDPSAKPSFWQKASSRYLRSRGFMDSKGKYKEGMEGLLTNGRRRAAKRVIGRYGTKAIDKMQGLADKTKLGRAIHGAMDKTGDKVRENLDKTKVGRLVHKGMSRLNIRNWEGNHRNMIEDVSDDAWSSRK